MPADSSADEAHLALRVEAVGEVEPARDLYAATVESGVVPDAGKVRVAEREHAAEAGADEGNLSLGAEAFVEQAVARGCEVLALDRDAPRVTDIGELRAGEQNHAADARAEQSHLAADARVPDQEAAADHRTAEIDRHRAGVVQLAAD